MDRIKDIFFDLDDTIWDFKRNSALTFEVIFKKKDLPIQMDRFTEIYKPINERYWKLYREDKIDRETLRFNRLMESFDQLEVKYDQAIIYELADDYIKHLADFNHLFPETFPILNYLKQKYRLHILTNGFEVIQERKLKNSKIDSYFETLTASDEVGVKKPHPYIFEVALERAETSKETSLMIGDNLEADILGATDFGLEAIHFNPEGNSEFKGTVIQSLGQLKELL